MAPDLDSTPARARAQAATSAQATAPDRSPVPPAKAIPAGPRGLAADLFAAPLALPRNPQVRMGGDYLIEGGDQLSLTTFGSLALARTLTVDRGGKINVPEVGIVQVAGLTLAGARAAVGRLLSRRHAGIEQFDLEVVALHDVQVFVIGDVPHPGSYLVPSSTSAVVLLGQAGGPGPDGSWRRIQHLRNGRLLRTLDLYALRFEGGGLEGPAFRDGDCLFVPLAGTRITVAGAFRRTLDPAGLVVELKDGEGAAAAVRYAGGLVPSAHRTLLTVQRTSGDGITSVADIPNRPAALAAAALFEGDVLRALVQRDRVDEYVEVAGAVAVPGRFAFHPGMRVRDALSLKGPGDQVLPRTYRLRGELLRTAEDGATRLLSFDVDRALRRDPAHDLPLQARDRLTLAALDDLRPEATVSVLGPLARPGAYPWHEGMRAADLLFLAGRPALRASRHEAELVRRDGQVIQLDLARLVATEAEAPVQVRDDRANPRLAPHDRITVYEDPSFRLQPTVEVTGQVRRPGPYVLTQPGATLAQVLQRAGGLTEEAMPAAAVFLRGQAQPGPGPDREARTDTAALNEVLQRLNETRRDKASGQLEPSPLLHGLVTGTTHRLVVDLPAVLKGDPRQDITLVDGDRIHIPRRSDSVYVAGEVASPFSTFHVRPGDRVKDILKLAGGYTRNADVSHVRLLKASGRLVDSGVSRARMEPGDALLVPQRIRKDVPWQDSLLAMTPLAVLYNAIRR